MPKEQYKEKKSKDLYLPYNITHKVVGVGQYKQRLSWEFTCIT